MLKHGPVIITGCPRSGTTALAYPLFVKNRLFLNELSVFSLAPNVTATELHRRFILYFGGTVDAMRTFKTMSRFCTLPLRPRVERIYRHIDNLYGEGCDLWSRVLRDEDAACPTRVFNGREGTGNNLLWGDKHPNFITSGQVGNVLETWPEAKVIYIQRDGRDAVNSMNRMGWESLESGWEKWIRSYRAYKEHEDRMLFVKQEDLLERPGSVIDKINAYLGHVVLDPGDYDIYIYKNWVGQEEPPSGVAQKKQHQGSWRELSSFYVPDEAQEILNELGY